MRIFQTFSQINSLNLTYKKKRDMLLGLELLSNYMSYKGMYGI